MSETKHTPGPWKAGTAPYISAATGEGHTFKNGDWYIYPGPIAAVSQKQNVSLIAAAPDLLAACEEILPMLEGTEINEDMRNLRIAYDKCKTAIAKAKGE